MVFKIFTRAIILDENDRVLLLKKNSKQKYWAWELMLPGWTLEFWEEITETLVREIKEETNLTVDKFILFDTVKMIIWEEHWLWVYKKYGTWKTRILLIFRLQRNWIIW